MRRRKMCISGYRNECFHNEALEMTKPTLYTNFMDPVTPLWRLPTQAVAINVTYPRPRFRAPIAQENINFCLSCRPNMICVVCNHGFLLAENTNHSSCNSLIIQFLTGSLPSHALRFFSIPWTHRTDSIHCLIPTDGSGIIAQKWRLTNPVNIFHC